MVRKLSLLGVFGVFAVGPASAATADQAVVSWTLRATRLNPYARQDYEPKVGTTPLAGPPGWACVGELGEMRYTQPTIGMLAVKCRKGDTIVSANTQCHYFDKPKPGAPAKGAYWTDDGRYQQLRLTVGEATWEFSVGCSVSSRHSEK